MASSSSSSASSHQPFKRHIATRLACYHRCKHKTQCKHACCKTTLPPDASRSSAGQGEEGDDEAHHDGIPASLSLPLMASQRAPLIIDALQRQLPDDATSLVLDYDQQEYIATMVCPDRTLRLLVYDPVGDQWSVGEETNVASHNRLCIYQGHLAIWRIRPPSKTVKGCQLEFNVRIHDKSWQSRVHVFKKHIDECLTVDQRTLAVLCSCVDDGNGGYLRVLTWPEDGGEPQCKRLMKQMWSYTMLLATSTHIYLKNATGMLCTVSIATRKHRVHPHKIHDGAALVELNDASILITGGTSSLRLFDVPDCSILDKAKDGDDGDGTPLDRHPVCPMKFARSHHALVKALDHVFAIGGRELELYGVAGGETIEMYDAAKDLWTVKSDVFPAGPTSASSIANASASASDHFKSIVNMHCHAGVAGACVIKQ